MVPENILNNWTDSLGVWQGKIVNNKKVILRQLIQMGEETCRTMPKVSTLPRGRKKVVASFAVRNPAMSQMAEQIGLTVETVMMMMRGDRWEGLRLKPIEAALLAPAFEIEQQARIADALEQTQRHFWERQHFYLYEMAGPTAQDIPNALMRGTSMALEQRVLAYLRENLKDSSKRLVVWVDYAAGPASFVNGALYHLQAEGIDTSRVVVILVEPAKHFRDFSQQQQKVLNELWRQGRLHSIDGTLEDGATYARVKNVLQQTGVDKADILTQAFGASYVADHLRPAMWKEMINTAKPQALKMVVAATNKYNPRRMIFDRLKDEITQKVRTAAVETGNNTLSAIRAFFQGVYAWVNAFARPVPVDMAGTLQPALMALIRYGKGVQDHCPIRQSGDAFTHEIEQATAVKVKELVPVLGGQAVLIRL